MSTYSFQRVVTKQINAVKPANSWDEQLENHYLRKCRLTRLEHMDALESNILFSIILNSLLRMLPHALYEPYISHSACYVWYGVLLVRKNKCLFLKTPLPTDLEA